MRDERRDGFAREFPTRKTFRFVVRLHLRDEFRVTTLRLENGDDADFLALGVPADEAMGQMFFLRAMTVLRSLDRMLLNQNPFVAAIFERLDVLVGGVGMIRQRHLRRRKTTHATQRFQTEDAREVILKRFDVQTKILRWRGRRDGMTPRHTEPFDGVTIAFITSDALESVEHVVQPHVTHPVEQRAGVFEHHARLFAFVNQLRHELTNAFVAPVKHAGVVIIADARIVHHVFEITDDISGREIVSASGNERLVHVERDGARAVDAAKINTTRGLTPLPITQGFLDQCFVTAKVREMLDVFRD